MQTSTAFASTRRPPSWPALVTKVRWNVTHQTCLFVTCCFLVMTWIVRYCRVIGTVHIFSLDGATPTNTGGNSQPQSHSGASQHDTDALASPSSTAATTNNTKSGLSFVRDMLPQGLVPKYFGSEWSFAQVRGLEGKCICAFDRDSPKITVSLPSESHCKGQCGLGCAYKLISNDHFSC